ncbi:MAG: hypothetical protein R3Y47_07550 [Lachnospiraceae bacterium]
MIRKNIVKNFLAIVLLLIMVVACFQKEGLHIDEYFTFQLSNNFYDQSIGFNPSLTQLTNYTGEELYEAILGVNDDTKFNIVNVFNKQSVDVHPPFYYVLINFGCSLLDNIEFLFVVGMGINITFLLLIYYVGSKLVSLYIDSEVHASLISFLACSTMGSINGVTFMRMYVMLAFISILTAHLLISNPPTSEKKNTFYIKLSLLTICGTLTHYYYVIYLSIIALTYGVLLLKNKKYKELLLGCTSVILGGG